MKKIILTLDPAIGRWQCEFDYPETDVLLPKEANQAKRVITTAYHRHLRARRRAETFREKGLSHAAG